MITVVLVPADKASNKIIFVCKDYYYECLLNELGFTSTSGNIPFIIEAILQRMKFLKIFFLFFILSTILKNQDQFALP
jgi:hypothetical protein